MDEPEYGKVLRVFRQYRYQHICKAVDEYSHKEKQEDCIMRFKWRDVRGAKVKTNYGKQKRDEEKKKLLKCFKETESFLTGTNTKKKSFSFNITFSSKHKEIKIPQNPLKK